MARAGLPFSIPKDLPLIYPAAEKTAVPSANAITTKSILKDNSPQTVPSQKKNTGHNIYPEKLSLSEIPAQCEPPEGIAPGGNAQIKESAEGCNDQDLPVKFHDHSAPLHYCLIMPERH